MGTIRPASVAVLAASLLVLGGLIASALLGPPRAQAQDPPAEQPYEIPTPTPTPTATPRPRAMSPFPIVRIVGSLTRSGARLTTLAVKTPPLARVEVVCTSKGLGCPAERDRQVVPDSTRTLVTFRLKRFERAYRAGAVIELHVARRGTIGKFARFTVRKGKRPRRQDACILYGADKPRSCP